MSLGSIFKKASSLFGLGGTDSLRPPPLDGEIIYCKNNVCVHPPASLLVESEHHPGYLTLRAQQNQSSRPTLVLTWIPNTTLKKNPHSIEGSPNLSRSNTPKVSPRRIPRQEFAKSDESVTLTPSPSPSTQDSSFSCGLQRKKFSQDTTSICSQVSVESHEESVSVSSSLAGEEQSKDTNSNSKLSSSCKSQTDSGLGGDDNSTGSSSSYSHNLTFPENAMTLSAASASIQANKERRSARDQLCGVFSVDLGQMRSLRLFYNDAACTQGQIVIASRESQYKILHFHNGGLDKLAEIFDDWSLFAQETDEGDKPYRQFLVVKPQLSDDQCHPEEHLYPLVCEDFWKLHMTEDGRVEDVFELRKAIFFGGIDPAIRHEVWPFLLHYFPFDSSFEDRDRIRNDKYIEYQNIRKVRESQSAEAQEIFWRNIQCIVEKDVVRTDRSHPYFRGEHNPNIVILKNILLNYAVANPLMGYTQGMSDLLAPVLAATQQEVEAYWCFSGLMTRTIFVSSPKDCDMDRQLNFLRELLRVTLPKFHYHLKLLGQDALELLFCHRWILLCFKREFCEVEALQIWEACWARYQTDYFHLFVCVAIVAIYGDDVVEQRLPADEILLHFSSLAMHMNGRLVLRKARGLLHEFRKRPKIPCTLYGLCSQVNAGMWDSGHAPTVECITHLGDDVCPYNSNPSSPVFGDE
ncbi:hypothetical protein EGW08_002528 [Elysia chlorotica]|uniref:Rab-GAP TBC domain-containing protein n=1 Tax=Elysia chlorotica TaxID=188477 RepID=A0A3S1I0C2_ELYCH|nr:hypothetical protein EGW08_002528 [Elysia chlorotica]